MRSLSGPSLLSSSLSSFLLLVLSSLQHSLEICPHVQLCVLGRGPGGTLQAVGLGAPVTALQAGVPVLLTPDHRPVLGPVVVLVQLAHLSSDSELGPAPVHTSVVEVGLLSPEVLMLHAANFLATVYLLFHIFVVMKIYMFLYVVILYSVEVHIRNTYCLTYLCHFSGQSWQAEFQLFLIHRPSQTGQLLLPDSSHQHYLLLINTPF